MPGSFHMCPHLLLIPPQRVHTPYYHCSQQWVTGLPPGCATYPEALCSVGFVRKLPFWASWLNVSDHLYFTFSILVHLSLYIVDWGGRCLLVPLKMDLVLPVFKLLIFWEKVETALSLLLHRRNTTYSHSPGASTNVPTAPKWGTISASSWLLSPVKTVGSHEQYGRQWDLWTSL